MTDQSICKQKSQSAYHRDLRKQNTDICTASSSSFLEPSIHEALRGKDQRFRGDTRYSGRLRGC